MIIDTDFFSSLLIINRLKLLQKCFSKQEFYITKATYAELLKAYPKKDIEKFVTEKGDKVSKSRFILVSHLGEEEEVFLKQLTKQYPQLGSGELESMALAKYSNDVILSNDKYAQKISRKLGIDMYGIVSFLLLLKKEEILEYNEIKTIIHLLEKKGNYRFTSQNRRKLISK